MDILLIILAYLLGSISCSILFCRLFNLPDPRSIGSKNAGATNVYRIGGKKVAILAAIGDVLKGVFPVWLGYLFTDTHVCGWIAFASVIGHIYPIYFKFKGGKGVATALGSLTALAVNLGLSILVIWLAVFAAKRISSLASLVATASIPFLTIWFVPQAFIPCTLIAVLIIYSHKDNIKRLREGNEKIISTSENIEDTK